MLFFRVDFKNNIAISANATDIARKQITWTESPKSIVSVELYANNNLHAIDMAQEKAEAWMKRNK